MKEIRTWAAMALICMCSLLLAAFPALGDEPEKEDVKINKVILKVTSNIKKDEPEDVEITSQGTGYSVEAFELDYEGGNFWEPTEYPRLLIYLTADEGYQFRKNRSSYTNIKGDVFRLVKTSFNGDYDMTVTVDLNPYGKKVGTPVDVSWQEPGTARWGRGYHASSYELVLKCGNKKIKSVTTGSTSYNFSSEMEAGKTYTFEVRSLNDDKKKSKVVKSGELVYAGSSADGVLSGEETPASEANGSAAGQWVLQDGHWWYRRTDGSWPADGWFYLSYNGTEQWYYFDSQGWMLSSTTTPDGYKVGADGAWIP